jgi:hypothetical protein
MDLNLITTEAKDIGAHAAHEAMRRLFDVLQNAPNRGLALAIAVGYVLHKMDGLLAIKPGDLRSVAMNGIAQEVRESLNKDNEELLKFISDAPIGDVMAYARAEEAKGNLTPGFADKLQRMSDGRL